MNYIQVEKPVLEKLEKVSESKKKRVYKDMETGITYYWFRNNGKGSKKGYYVDLETVANKEAFIEMSKNFEKERAEYEKILEQEKAHNKWVKQNMFGIKKILGNLYFSECEAKTKNWDKDQKRKAEEYQSAFNIEEEEERKEVEKRVKELPEPLRCLADENGVFHGFKMTNDSNCGGGRGYCGYSLSRNATIAKREGKFPKTGVAKILKVKPEDIEKCLYSCEYHHTSKNFNSTDFYDIRPYYYLMNNEADSLVKYLYEIDDIDIEDEEELIKAIEEYKKIYNKMVSKKRRIS